MTLTRCSTRMCHAARLAALAAIILCAEPAWALRCDGKIIDTQETASQVLALCGEPDLRDEWTDHHGYMTQEQWYYNFGPRRLLHILTLRGGRLVKLETDGYGFIANRADTPGCRPNEIQTGMNKLYLDHLCGKPEQIQVYVGYGHPTGYRHDYHRSHSSLLKREEWHYNFGPRLLRRTVILENGRVTYIESEGYGD